MATSRKRTISEFFGSEKADKNSPNSVTSDAGSDRPEEEEAEAREFEPVRPTRHDGAPCPLLADITFVTGRQILRRIRSGSDLSGERVCFTGSATGTVRAMQDDYVQRMNGKGKSSGGWTAGVTVLVVRTRPRPEKCSGTKIKAAKMKVAEKGSGAVEFWTGDQFVAFCERRLGIDSE